MRIATSTVNERTTEAIARQQSRLSDLQSRLSSGQRVEKPSDDPSAAAQAERLRARDARLAAEGRMIDQARTTLQQADSVMGSAVEELQVARELLLTASTDTLNASDRASIAVQLRGALGNLLALANHDNGTGGYVFGGAGVTAAPFVLAGQVTYQAQSGEQVTATEPALAVTQDGGPAFMNLPDGAGGTRSIFATLEAAAAALEDPSLAAAQRRTTVGAGIDGIDASIDRLSQVRTRVGESLKIIDSRTALNEADSVNLRERLGELVDLDYAAALGEFASTQTAVQAAMQTYAQVARLSLFSYL
jgi:flagellar hook-associated protein 3 FlgL